MRPLELFHHSTEEGARAEYLIQHLSIPGNSGMSLAVGDGGCFLAGGEQTQKGSVYLPLPPH